MAYTSDSTGKLIEIRELIISINNEIAEETPGFCGVVTILDKDQKPAAHVSSELLLVLIDTFLTHAE